MARLAQLVVIAGLLVPPCTVAIAQNPRGAPPPRPAAGADAPRAAFEALPETDRIAIQDALVWTGDYAGGADGTFGRRTQEAIAAWQTRNGRPSSGLLDAPSRAALLAAAGKARVASGFAAITDAASNVRIGLPQKLLVKKTPNTIGGTRYQSKDDKVTLDTRSQPGTPDDLQQLFERNVGLNTPGRTITYKLSRPDFFVIAGETAGGRFYSRYAQGEGTIRGFSIGYDRASAAELDRFVVAIANSFVPFPGERPQAGMAATIPAVPVLSPSPLARLPITATGLALGPRQVLAPASAIEGCSDPRLDGAPGRVEKLAADGFMILAPAAPRRAVPVRIASDPKPGPATVIFAAVSEGGRMVVTPAEITGPSQLVAPLQNGAAGAVVVDGAGGVVGMVARVAEGRRAVAGLVPPAGHDFVPASRLPVSSAGSANPEIAVSHPTAALLPAVVRITCGPAPRP